MRLARLEISSQLGTIDIRSRPARLEGTPPYLNTTIRGNAGARVGLDITHPRVHIDSTPSQESIGIYSVLRRYEKFAAESNQRGIAQIGRIAREGLQIMKIERGGGGGWDACRRIARSKGMKGPAQLTIKTVAPPNINAQMGEVTVRDESRRVQTTAQKGADTTNYTPASVSITWRTQPLMEITFIPGNHTGLNVDAVI
jgi:hypothetical protein